MTVCKYFYENFGFQITDGFFIEIGAFDGRGQNSTLVLEEAGWKGICVEPMPWNIRKIKKNRKCRIIEGAIWNKSGKVTIADVGIPGWSGIMNTHQPQHQSKYSGDTITIKANCYRFEEIGPPIQIDYLQLDTEGSELDILKDINTKKYNIDYICIEDNLSANGSTLYHDFMCNYGYELLYEFKQDKLYKKLKT